MSRAVILFLLILASAFGVAFSQRRRAKPKPKPKPPARIIERVLTVTVAPAAEMVCSSGQCPTLESRVKLTANSNNRAGDQEVSFEWTAPVGKISSTGNSATWDLKGVNPGEYVATVRVSDQHSGKGTAQQQIKVIDCGPCSQNSTPCPLISVSCPEEVDKTTALKFIVTVARGPELHTPITYLWTVSAGKIINGEKDKELEVALPEDEDSVRGTVFVGGYDPRCATIASCTSKIRKQ
jgi:hypothetical protein